MKIKIKAGDLKSAVRISNLCVDGKTEGISSHLLFRVNESSGKLEIMSKSARVFSVCPVTSELEGEASSFTVEAWRLTKWVSCIGDKNEIVLTVDDGSILAKSGRSKVKFRSLDPISFRSSGIDSLFAASKECCTVDPSSVSRAVSVGKVFVSQEDTTKPENCQIVSWDSVLASTDRRGVCNVTTPYEGLQFRIPFKDINTVCKYLEDKDTIGDNVVLLTASRPKEEGGAEFDFFLRPDGAYLGVSRLSMVPKRVVAPEEDHEAHATIEVDNEEFHRALSFLSASAPKDHHAVKFSIKDGGVEISMPSAAGGEDSHPMVSTNSEGQDLEFFLDHHYITSLFGVFDLNQMKLGVVKTGDKGYVTVHHKDIKNNNRYSVALLCHF